MNKYAEIKEYLYRLPMKKMDQKEQDFIQHYLGTSKKVLGVKIDGVVKIAKEVIRNQDQMPTDELESLLNNLFAAGTFEEHAIAGKILTFLKPTNRAKISFTTLEKWLSNSHGWVEIDVICQSLYPVTEVLDRWTKWQKMIEKFRKSNNISLRRASLVLQNYSVRKMSDPKMRQLAFETVEILKHEKEILITKAISWLLRCLVDQDKEEVRKYLIKNELTLPRIAYRETMKKIETGTKNKSKAKNKGD